MNLIEAGLRQVLVVSRLAAGMAGHSGELNSHANNLLKSVDDDPTSQEYGQCFVRICHETGSNKNPYEAIQVGCAAERNHIPGHPGDFPYKGPTWPDTGAQDAGGDGITESDKWCADNAPEETPEPKNTSTPQPTEIEETPIITTIVTENPLLTAQATSTAHADTDKDTGAGGSDISILKSDAIPYIVGVLAILAGGFSIPSLIEYRKNKLKKRGLKNKGQ